MLSRVVFRRIPRPTENNMCKYYTVRKFATWKMWKKHQLQKSSVGATKVNEVHEMKIDFVYSVPNTKNLEYEKWRSPKYSSRQKVYVNFRKPPGSTSPPVANEARAGCRGESIVVKIALRCRSRCGGNSAHLTSNGWEVCVLSRLMLFHTRIKR